MAIQLTEDDRAELERRLIYLREALDTEQFGIKWPASDIEATNNGIRFKNDTQDITIPYELLVLDGWHEIHEWTFERKKKVDFEKTQKTYLYVKIDRGTNFGDSVIGIKGGVILSSLQLKSGNTAALVEVPAFIKRVKQNICPGITSYGLGCCYSFDHISATIHQRKTDYIEPIDTTIYEQLLFAAKRQTTLDELLGDPEV